MELPRAHFIAMAVAALLLALVAPSVNAHTTAPAPAPAPTSDGVAIDQGIAYVLMVVALLLYCSLTSFTNYVVAQSLDTEQQKDQSTMADVCVLG